MSDALQQLEPDLRNVLWLREVEGYSYDELASILGLPLGTVKSRLFSAREQLRRVWQTTNQTTTKENS
jgi:RNA polymerase sigma-70 factor (ECF subfamily)